MKLRTALLGAAGVCLLGLSAAHATPSACVTAPVSVYDAKGFSCLLGPNVLVHHFSTTTHDGRDGSAALFNITPTSTGVLKLSLSEANSTGPAGYPFGFADASLGFEAIALNGTQFLGGGAWVTGTTTGNGSVNLDASVNGQFLSTKPGHPVYFTFSPTNRLTFHNDQLDSARDATGTAISTLFVNTLGLKSDVPAPPGIVPLSLALFGLCMIQLAKYQRPRRP